VLPVGEIEGVAPGVGGGANHAGVAFVDASIDPLFDDPARLFGHLARAVAGGIVAVPGGYGAVGGAAQAVVPIPLQGREVGHGGDVPV